MNPFFQKIIVDSVIRQKKKQSPDNKDYSQYEFAKAYHEFKLNLTDLIRDIIFIALGIISATFGLKGFLIPNSFIDGGATGIGARARRDGVALATPAAR